MAVEAPPKGISEITLSRVIEVVEESTKGEMSAAEVARSTGMSAVTARRYLRFLVLAGKASVSCRYGKVGAPERLYRLSRASACGPDDGGINPSRPLVPAQRSR
jgi:response regulator of citrate/malate metabolism